MSTIYSPKIVTDGLVLMLDAANPKSYPGTGTVWYDLSGNNNHFDIVSTAFNNGNTKYMDFNGSYGCAKKVDVDMVIDGSITAILWTRIKDSTAEWRTLFRGRSSNSNHQVIIQSGAWDIGAYNSTNGTYFTSAAYSQQSLPGYGTSQWNMLIWRWNDGSPYYNLSYNDTPSTIRGQISGINGRFNGGICSIGAYNNGVQTDPSQSSQPWGDISNISLYNRFVSDNDCLQYYNTTKGRFGL